MACTAMLVSFASLWHCTEGFTFSVSLFAVCCSVLHPIVLNKAASRCTPSFTLGFSMCHDVPKDIGRLPRRQRVCQECALSEIGYQHLILACTAAQFVRDHYAGLSLCPNHTMSDFMWQAHLVKVAKIVVDCLNVIAAGVGAAWAPRQP